MSDVATVSAPVINTIRGRIPTVESLQKKIARIHKVIARANKLESLIPELERKLAIVSDPNFVKMSEARQIESLERKTDRAEKLLASLPDDVVKAILAKLGK